MTRCPLFRGNVRRLNLRREVDVRRVAFERDFEGQCSARIEQNNIIKVLTIVSVVGIPPTLIASMYGRNFKGMPEYDWAWGYPYALAMIALSAVLPLVWFKWRGWI